MCSEPKNHDKKRKESRYYDHEKNEDLFAHNTDDPGPYPKAAHQKIDPGPYPNKEKQKEKDKKIMD